MLSDSTYDAILLIAMGFVAILVWLIVRMVRQHPEYFEDESEEEE
jgi:flagellar biogenesis protein FliO